MARDKNRRRFRCTRSGRDNARSAIGRKKPLISPIARSTSSPETAVGRCPLATASTTANNPPSRNACWAGANVDVTQCTRQIPKINREGFAGAGKIGQAYPFRQEDKTSIRHIIISVGVDAFLTFSSPIVEAIDSIKRAHKKKPPTEPRL